MWSIRRQVYYVFSLTAILSTIQGEKGQEMVRRVRTIVTVFLLVGVVLVGGIVVNVVFVDNVCSRDYLKPISRNPTTHSSTEPQCNVKKDPKWDPVYQNYVYLLFLAMIHFGELFGFCVLYYSVMSKDTRRDGAAGSSISTSAASTAVSHVETP